MRALVRLLACAAAVAVTACDAVDRRYFREGIGTELATPELPDATRLQEVYIGHICRQAGFPVVVDADGTPACDYAGLPPNAWMLFVQAGMNDIDQRCDAYLQWLDSRRRFSTAAMQQISDTRTATEAIMGFTGANVKAISVVGAAFGFAAQTFTNLNTRLLLEVNQATVQSLVLNRQREYREDIRNRLINNRPIALHALRSYLRLCMPMTIETEINVTVTALERSSTVPDRMISAATVAPTIINDPRNRLPKRNGATEDQIRERQRVLLAAVLCVPAATDESLDDARREFLVGLGILGPNEKSIPDTKPMRDALDRARSRPACKNSTYVSAFEVGRYGAAPRTREAARKTVVGLQDQLRTLLGMDLERTGSFDPATREAIKAAREKLGLGAGNNVNFEFLVRLENALKNKKT